MAAAMTAPLVVLLGSSVVEASSESLSESVFDAPLVVWELLPDEAEEGMDRLWGTGKLWNDLGDLAVGFLYAVLV